MVSFKTVAPAFIAFASVLSVELLLTTITSLTLFGIALTTLVIESAKDEVINDKYGKLILFDRKNYGDKVVSYFEVEEQ